MFNADENYVPGILGTLISATGAGLSVTDVQAIVSIIVTVLGFVISVIIPLVMKLVKQIKKAKKDGKIDKEEIHEITSTVKEIVDESSKFIDEVSDKKSEGEK